MSFIGGSLRTIRPGNESSTGGTDESIMVRSLRRQLYEALAQNNAKLALNVFLMTRTQYLEQFKKPNHSKKESKESMMRAAAVLDKTAILAECMNPLDPFQEDDAKSYKDKYEIHESAQPPRKKLSQLFRRKRNDADTPISFQGDATSYYSTPLHQAARLGSLELLRLFLSKTETDDLDVRDGQGRTLLHCLAGAAGELPPMVPMSKPPRRFGFRTKPMESQPPPTPPPAVLSDRITIALILLENNSISTNAVDKSMGRTALHYAAERNWEGLCDTLLQNSAFDTTMLTLVDSAGRTPAELATHQKLSASLEAKCILAVDPYGTMSDQFSNADTLANPFGWFETNSIRRKARIEQALTKIQALTKGILAQSITVQDLDTEPTPADIVEESIVEAHDDPDDNPALATPVVELSAIPNSYLLSNVHEKHVEKLLEHFEWNVKTALQKFFTEPFETLSEAGVHLQECKDTSSQPKICQICCEEDIDDKEWAWLAGCPHGFCRDCLTAYLKDCEKSKSHLIECPHHECQSLLSPTELRSLGPYEALESIADEFFVMKALEYRFCPEPGCGCPVRLNFGAMAGPRSSIEGAQKVVKLVGGVCSSNPDAPMGSPLTYQGVPDPNYYSLTHAPRQAHRFCMACGDRQIHWPVDCQKLVEWKDIIKEHVDEAGGGDAEVDHDAVAQSLWMKTNTRPCPKCDAPIQKNEGCNHMTCSNPHCKHEFCWICRNDWKRHNSETGGFFRCNRWAEDNDHKFYDGAEHNSGEATDNPFEDLGDPRTLEVTYGTAMHETRASREKASKMDRFIHHYQRWSAHRDSAALEKHMSEEAVSRLAPVVDEMLAFTGSENLFGGKGLSFIHAAFMELLESRSMLQHSYAFSYLRYKSEHRRGRIGLFGWKSREKAGFERAQSELELLTEQISDVVARKHIRATQEQIVYLTKATAQKRNDFSNTMVQCLKAESEEEKQQQQNEGVQEENAWAENGGETAASRSLLRQSLSQLIAWNDIESLVDYQSEEDVADWMCPSCTFVNNGRRRCEMCNGYRPR